mmetsp:Transcript_13019/g.36773  ORF Transcript_13019/g.36773 Transcript_13019/m.36773 type:complete len:214 (+) Transcript_13019:1265-1906(+)
MVLAVVAQDRAEGAVCRPSQQVSSRATLVPAAVGVDKGLEVVDARVDHGFDARLQVHVVARPPDGVAVLRGALGGPVGALGARAWPRVVPRKLGQRDAAAVVGPSAPQHPVEPVHDGEVDVRPPGRVAEPQPVAGRARLVHRRGGDRDSPVDVEPPEVEPAGHPGGQALPAKGHLFGGSLQAPRAPACDREGVVVEECAQTLAPQVREERVEI